MNFEEITLIATFVANNDDDADTLEPMLLSLIEPTRAEPGCIEYRLHRHAEDTKIFTFVERFKDKDAMQAHLAKDYVQKVMDEAPALLKDMQLNKLFEIK